MHFGRLNGSFLNSISRHELSWHNKFITNKNGSVKIDLVAESPGNGKGANWLLNKRVP